jgi:hypothetical protein
VELRCDFSFPAATASKISRSRRESAACKISYIAILQQPIRISDSRRDPFITMVKTVEFCDFDNRTMFHDLTLHRTLLVQRPDGTRWGC